MNRTVEDQQLINDLNEYLSINNPVNGNHLSDFLDSDVNLYSRLNSFGHITASAWILSHDLSSALLIHHKKLNIWVSPGGHVDPGESPLQAAAREAHEEVGIGGLIPLSMGIFDLDIHRIPESAKKGEPEHWHADIRYAFRAGPDARVEINLDECNDFSWRKISDILDSDDFSTKRMAQKTLILVNGLAK